MMMMVDGPFLNLANETYDKVDNVKIKITDDLIAGNIVKKLIVKDLSAFPSPIKLVIERDKYARRYFANDHYLLSSPDFNVVNKDGRTLLTNFISSVSGSPTDITFLERLLADGADVNFCAQYYGQPKSGIDFIVERKSDILKSVLVRDPL